MHPSQRLTGALFAAIVSLTAYGCGGREALAEKERENSVLRFENERRRASLIESLEEIAKQRQTIADLAAEKQQVAQQLNEIGTRNRSAGDELAAALKERDDARARLAEAQQTIERLKESTEKVREVASTSVSEIADLRTRNRELEARVASLTASEAAFREEAARSSRHAKELEGQLASVRAGNQLDPQTQALEREIAGLRGENLALQKRLEAVASVDVSRSEKEKHAMYREDPTGLLAELGGLLGHRIALARQGQIAWDGFDIAVVVTGALVLLLLVRFSFRLLGLRGKPRTQARQVESPAAEAEPAVEEEAAVQPEEPATRRRASVRRRSAYPAIISAKDLPGEEAAGDDAAIQSAVAESIDAGFEAAEPVAVGAPLSHPTARATAEPPQAAEPRKIIGARSWEPEEGLEGSGEDDLASTQVIPAFSAGQSESVPVQIVPLKGAAAAAEKKPAPKKASGPERVDDRQLLAELKSVINRKFDDLMK